MTPLGLDLFCCEGGASMGYHRAGFRMYGLDLFTRYNPARYPFPYTTGDAIDALRTLLDGGTLTFSNGAVLGLRNFAALFLSPPCQRYSITNAARQHDYPDLIGPSRALARQTGLPYVIENVERAPLISPVMLCGRMFGLSAIDTDGIKLVMDRHRIFESNVSLTVPEHPVHGDEWVAGSYGGARRDKYEAKYVRKGGYVPSIPVQRELLGIDWMTQNGMFQSIPPVYTEYLGAQILAAL